MSDNVIYLEARRPLPPQGNGAREALIDVVQSVPELADFDCRSAVDFLLASLALRGYAVVPHIWGDDE